MSKGGYRKGSGRPHGTGKYNEETIPVRVPKSLLPKVNKILSDFIKEKSKAKKSF
ncbi:MAG: hypothetical protein ABWZ79_16750 [Pedobacter agri]